MSQPQYYIGVMKTRRQLQFQALISLDERPAPGEYEQVFGPFDSELDRVTQLTGMITPVSNQT